MEQKEKIEAILSKHRDDNGALLPILEEAQEAIGYLTPESLQAISTGLTIPLTKVVETASFYQFLRFQPRGKYLIQMCESAPCCLSSAKATLSAIERALCIKPGETTPDGKFTLELTGCIGVCDRAPALLVNGEAFGPIRQEDVEAFLGSFE